MGCADGISGAVESVVGALVYWPDDPYARAIGGKPDPSTLPIVGISVGTVVGCEVTSTVGALVGCEVTSIVGALVGCVVFIAVG